MKMGHLTLAVALALAPAASAPAGMLLAPGGNPTGPSVAGDALGIVFLNPIPAFETGQPQLLPVQKDDDMLVRALAAQGFSAANGYTFTYTNLANNDITLTSYKAFADAIPPISAGDKSFPGAPVVGYGGATMGMAYKAGAGDPAAIHWISIIEDNTPNAYETANGVADPYRAGFTLSVDNPGSPAVAGNPKTPFYDDGGVADTTGFIDAPNNPMNLPSQLIFHTFVVTQAAKAFTIYDDVTWGFQIVSVPEPSSLVLTALGGFGALAIGRRRLRLLAA